jgi:hypothetical protein
MTGLRTLAVSLLSVGILQVPAAVRADTIVGGISFDDTAFADVLLDSFRSFAISSGPFSPSLLESVLVGSNTRDYAFSNSPGAFVKLGFTDNFLVNGTGADLALFAVVSRDPFTLTVGELRLVFPTVETDNPRLNVALIDLSAFGLAPGTRLRQIFVGGDPGFPVFTVVPPLTAAGAINSAPVPEPASLLLLGVGLSGIAFQRLRRRYRPSRER